MDVVNGGKRVIRGGSWRLGIRGRGGNGRRRLFLGGRVILFVKGCGYFCCFYFLEE